MQWKAGEAHGKAVRCNRILLYGAMDILSQAESENYILSGAVWLGALSLNNFFRGLRI